MLSIDQIRKLPKVALHDHLDGGLRPQTVIDLAREVGHELPSYDAEQLGQWFYDAASSGSLEKYLETFVHTVAVTQTPTSLIRVAREFVQDQAADGVIYAEARWAPSQHLSRGMSKRDAIAAVRDGLNQGIADVAAQGKEIIAQQLVTGMRQQPVDLETAQLAIDFRDDSVAGFDLAGPELGFSPVTHLPAFELLRSANAYYTIHAGEAAGIESIWSAIQQCGALRIGHGVRINDDIAVDPTGSVKLGTLAAFVLNQQIPLEMCPTSNVQTGAVPSLAQHPINLLAELNFNVSVSCDNRLMSKTNLSTEFYRLAETFDFGVGELEWFTVNAAQSAFLADFDRNSLIDEIITPAFTSASQS